MDTADRIIDDILATMRGAAPSQTSDIRMPQALRNLAACYRKAQKEPLARIPSYLEAALENVAALIPPPGPYEERRAEPRDYREPWEKDQSGRYDMSPRGGQLEPGS